MRKVWTIDIRIEETRLVFCHRIVFVNGRPVVHPWFWARVMLPFGFAAQWPYPWPLWSKHGTPSRQIAAWMGWDVVD